jgi:hypothetical protein
MRYLRLTVEAFQGIEAATVDFAPGLNVLYGPNDLGKSTLATAIRAALLLPVTSSEAHAFEPWHAGRKPVVTLDFLDGQGLHWRVKKAFGGPSGAQLWSSNDGASWTSAEKGRAVDGRLRELLPWGVASPGGKNAPRGMPESFIVNALLPRQGEVEALLHRGLDDDAADSGKVSLTKALSALAQDPLFKKVLDRAQAEVEKCFTETGARKTSRTSPLTAAGEAVKRLQVERDALTRQVADAEAVAQRASMLRERRAELGVELQEAREALELARAALVVQRADQARRAAASLAATAEEKKRAVEITAASLVEAQRLASGDGQRQRELQRAQVEAMLSALTAKRRELEARLQKIEFALKARADLGQARTEAQALRAEGVQLAQAHARAVHERSEAQGELELAEGIVAYGRWRVALDAAQAAVDARAQAAKLTEEAVAREVEAQQHERAAQAAVDEGAMRRATLPTQAQLEVLERLAHDRDVAEARLGGGLAVAVRPRRAIALHAVADDGAPLDLPGLKAEQLFEADRRVLLTVGDLLEVEITAGAKEARRTVEVLRRRWKEEMLTALERAEVASLVDLQAAVKAAAVFETAAHEHRTKAAAARSAAESARARGALLEKQPSGSKDELEAKEARIGTLPREILARFFTSMGASWETQCEELRKAKGGTLQTRRAAVVEVEAKQQQVRWRLDEVGRLEAEGAAMLPRLLEQLGGTDLAVARVQSSSELTAVVEALGATQPEAVATGSRDVAEATVKEREVALVRAQAELADALKAAAAREGEAKALEASVPTEQRRALQLRPPLELAAAEAAAARAEALFDEVSAEFNKADGALTSLAGPMAKERQQQLDEALAAAREREHELNADADAWKLLRDALREAESSQTAHLGKALGGEVATRFLALTRGRYAGVAIGPTLEVETIELPGADGGEVLASLSHGTKDQLATLVRLCVASSMRSAIVLDDQLVHTDGARLHWFTGVLREVARHAQTLVFTCRPLDYLEATDLPVKAPSHDAAGVRAIDLTRLIHRHYALTGTNSAGP